MRTHIPAQLATTRITDEVTRLITRTIYANGIALLTGVRGIGKRTAAIQALEAHYGTQPLTIELPLAYTARDLVRWIHNDVTAVSADHGLPTRDLQDDTVELLKRTQRPIVIANSERLTREAAAHLQWLHQRSGSTWPLILIGNQAAYLAIEHDEIMAAAITETHHCKPLTGDEIVNAVRGMHKHLAFTHGDLILAIDSKVCHGSLAYWRMFIAKLEALWDLENTDLDYQQLTVEMAARIVDQMPAFAHKGRDKR